MFVVLGLLSSRTSCRRSRSGLASQWCWSSSRAAAAWASTAFSRSRPSARFSVAAARRRPDRAQIVLSSGIEGGNTIFNAVFFVVLASALAQGTTLEWVAERLGVAPRASAAPATAAPAGSLDLVDFAVAADHSIAGSTVRELGLPRTAFVAAVARAGETIRPEAGTAIRAGDRLFVLVPRGRRADLDDVLARWRRLV
jgi:cell volume regulation protein A